MKKTHSSQLDLNLKISGADSSKKCIPIETTVDRSNILSISDKINKSIEKKRQSVYAKIVDRAKHLYE